jgi:hypothetical protein
LHVLAQLVARICQEVRPAIQSPKKNTSH